MSAALTVTALIERAARTFTAQELTEVSLDGHTTRHALHEVAAAALAFGRGLRALGLPEGGVVATLMGNHREHLEAQLGVPAAGLVLHALSPRHPQEALLRSLRRANDRVMLTDAEHLPLARALCDAAGIEHLVVRRGMREARTSPWDEVVRAGETHALAPPREGDTAMLCDAVLRPGLLRTAVYSHRAVVLHAMACATVDGLGLGRRDVILPAMPLYHANGCGLPLVTALVGARLVLLPADADLARLRETLEREAVTFAAGVTSAWVALDAALRGEREARLAPSLRLMAGGSAAPDELIKSLAAQGVTLVPVYGMTETGPLATSSHDGARDGRVVPLMELRVVDARGEPSEVGEVQLRAPWVATHYLGDGVTADRWCDDAWLRTGDRGRALPDGALRYIERMRPMIRCGAEWIDGEALERLARSHPAVASASVRCVAHPELVEQPALDVTLRGSGALDEDALRAHITAGWRWGAPPPMRVSLRVPSDAMDANGALHWRG